ncbi:2-hydroxyacid dehydrogenase [Sporomusa termitida]|uniref:2-hydroxyacid dehydrogenase n=1 Tax=Sporomusa termitida TaxID=2377 RepID=A0A517DNT2_9FIRM|nr:NAD(P)-dependent oxidoreductase [Sporomusa termitida]QDR78968.1 Putative 2-hydroxyacid dehydrogenase [Sporomusa termitida]
MAVIVSVMPKWRFDTSRVELPPHWDFQFINPATDAELINACRQADCLLVPASFPVINAAMLRQLSHLQLIQTVGAGYDLIDSMAAAELGIPVANVPGANAKSVAEFTVGLIIALQRQLCTADRETKAGHYAAIRQALLKTGLNEISGSVIGLVGLGAIGCQVARIMTFLGASVCYYSRSGSAAALVPELAITYKPLHELLAISNIVSVHVPLTADTRGLIGRYELGLMPAGSLLVNTARGEVIDQQALAAMLETGHLGGAAVDVVAPEPPPPDHPLLSLSPAARDRLLITPHIAGVTIGAFRDMLLGALENIGRVLAHTPPHNVVNGVAVKNKDYT